MQKVAAEIKCSPAQIALAWVITQSGITSTILGASKPEQLSDNLASLSIALTSEQLNTLNEVSQNEPDFFTPEFRQMIFGGYTVQDWC